MWQPPISEKQALITRIIKRFLLLTGPRLASKTIGAEHACMWHLWNTPKAVGMMLGRTVSQNSDSGPWAHLTGSVMPKWVAGDFGMELVTPMRSEAITHKLYFEVTNRFYEDDPEIGVSRMYLDSLDSESDAENRFKGKYYSLIYWTELSNFKLRKTFDVMQECLRCDWLRPDQQQIIADTNPAEEGTDSWIWKLWYWFRTVDLDNLTDDAKEELNLTDVPEEEWEETIMGLRELQSELAVIEFSIDDNIFITAAQKRAQRAKYAHNRDLLDRYYYGKWIRAAGDGIFSEVFRPEIQLIGQDSTPSEPEYALPELDCIELGGGADIGRRNTAIAFIEPIQMLITEETKDGPKQFIKTGFKILDEYVSLGQQQRMGEIAEEVLEKHDFWSGHCGKPPLWRYISDNSAFSPDLNETDEAKELYRLTNGIIELESIIERVPSFHGQSIKGHGAVERRISMMQKLLFENRILVNAVKCPNTVEMLTSIRRNAAGKLSTTNIFKHIFDAISYYIAFKCWLEMVRVPRIQTNKERGGIVVTSL